MKNVTAIIYQAEIPPSKDGIIKPLKPGGYSDSGADIGYSLKKQNINIVTPNENPDVNTDLDWVFPDTKNGIQEAIKRGATIIWLNTVLYRGHPIELFFGHKELSFIGQLPQNVDLYDDKLFTNDMLSKNGLPVPKSFLFTRNTFENSELDFSFPVVLKPLRGRGSEGVTVVNSRSELIATLRKIFESGVYGDSLFVEEFLSGQELTISVMPPGKYSVNGRQVFNETYWSLPPVKRINHANGIAPYNGLVAVVKNSEVLTMEEYTQPGVSTLMKLCEHAANLVNARSVIRIDCRADFKNEYHLFDLNMKPNMTGASRVHRKDQDSLTAMAARGIGWNFDDLIFNIYNLSWHTDYYKNQ